MTLHSTSDSSSILKDGKLKPGIYKIQNLQSETYLDIVAHTRDVCGRPAKDLAQGRGIWEIKSSGAGYTVQRFDPGKPEEFCIQMENKSPLAVAAYPVPWRVEVVDDDKYRGHEYVRFFWGTTNRLWALALGSKEDGTKVMVYDETIERYPNRIWMLIPVKVEGGSSENLCSCSLPAYDREATGQSSARAQHAEYERDDFGTIVTEVTTITTRKRYRVQDV